MSDTRTPDLFASSTRRDRPAAAGAFSPSLAGDFTRAGASLRRADGLALIICRTSKPQLGPRDAARFVKTVAPGVAIRYAGNLYPPGEPGADDLDGCQFQDRQDGTRYALTLTRADSYTVRALARSRRGRMAR